MVEKKIERQKMDLLFVELWRKLGWDECKKLALVSNSGYNLENFAYIMWKKDERIGDQLMKQTCKKGIIRIVQTLVIGGIDINKKDMYGWTSLQHASNNGHTETVRLLLDVGANINEKTNYGCTPLHWASSQGRIEITRLLLERGANPNEKDNDGKTPLHWAYRNNYTEMVKLLKSYGDIE